MSLLKTASHLPFSFYRAARKIRNSFFFHRNPSRLNQYQLFSISSFRLEGRKNYSLLFNFHNSLLRPHALFSFFMLVAFEGGGLIRAILLFLSYSFILLLGPKSELALRVMVFVTFCGLSCRNMNVVARAVLPKIYLEEIDRRSYKVAAAAGRRVVVSSLPKVMVKRFVEDCFGESEVLAPELEVVGGRYFTGRFAGCGTVAERLVEIKDRFAEEKADVGLVGFSDFKDQLLIPFSKEVYMVTKEEPNSINSTRHSSCAVAAASAAAAKSTVNHSKKISPKPQIFHDGRLAFLPTPSNSLFLLYIPFGFLLCVVRILAGLLLPYSFCHLVSAALGIHFRMVQHRPHFQPSPSGVLYVCTHRTLLDPIFLSYALFRPIPVVTYSLSRFSESLSPIPTVRLTRNRLQDSHSMRRLLASGDLAVCPEGTTCREPYLLRFSPLFAELADNIEPVAIDSYSSMFFGTTATGFKSLDPIFFFMNPRPAYQISFLGRVPKEMTVAGGWTAADVANRIQRELAAELGFECTSLTRRDKYLLLAGSDGVVPDQSPEKC
ncbi:glycerol-3-phosphate acyltransferase 1-like [Phalaenopsis equestris]|uniref:glycerol-3-phosphate acyltransferase 1-like n=1 Tax=Phalaenopsis equestris TaxID=78828 RepID=UPI0009E1DEDA|nr:glycerol-3-phosphate acyltransferase 1-like [Phalaenopsis equestris]